MQGTRADAIPINVSTIKDNGARGFSFTFEDRCHACENTTPSRVGKCPPSCVELAEI